MAEELELELLSGGRAKLTMAAPGEFASFYVFSMKFSGSPQFWELLSRLMAAAGRPLCGLHEALQQQGLNRVTDTCIPEEEAMRRIEREVLKFWQKAEREGQSYFPFEYMYQLIRSTSITQYYETDPAESWVVAACQNNLPIWTPGWEDSTLGNLFVSNLMRGAFSSFHIVRSGLEQMVAMVEWYKKNSQDEPIGFFQIGGGIAGDFSICVPPLITQDLREQCKLWGYFCQISDSTTSYGSYSGAVPNEKITWGKLDRDTPRFIIESDASIVVPLIFADILGM